MKILDLNAALELKSAAQTLSDTPQSRIIEQIASQDPALLAKAGFILALCEMYFYRKVTTGDVNHLIELIKKHPDIAHINFSLVSDFEGSPV